MKIAAVTVLLACLLMGCNARNDALNQAMDLRKCILEAQECRFQSAVTADYGENIYTFQMDCVVDSSGTLEFTVTDPQTIAGITGRITDSEASLIYEDKILAFPMLADGTLTPVSAPWIFINTLRSGYITGCSEEKDGLCLYIDDSYEENPLQLQIYTDEIANPVSAEIIWKDRRILSLDIRNFTIQ